MIRAEVGITNGVLPGTPLHTGRSWAARLQPNSRTEAELVQRIRVFFADAVLAQKLTEEALGSQDDSGVV